MASSGHVTRAAAKNKQSKNVASEEVHGSRDGEGESDNADPSRHLTLADLQRCMSEFSDKICVKLNALTEEVGLLTGKIDDLEGSVNLNSEKIRDLEKDKLPKLASELAKLEEKLLLLEIYNRKSNLLFYGIAERNGENVFAELKKAFVSLGLSEEDAAKIALVNAHRLPRRPQSTSSVPSTPTAPAPAPIIAKFITMTDRDRIFAAFEKKQRDRGKIPYQHDGQPISRMTVRSDLPPILKSKRGILASKAYHLRKERGVSTRIFLKGVKMVLEWKEKGTTRWNEFQE